MASSGGFNLPITGDNKDFLKAASGAGEAAEDLARELDKYGEAGDDAARLLQEGLERAADAADDMRTDLRRAGESSEQSLEGVEAQARDTADTISRGFDTASREMARKTEAGATKAQDAIRETKSEALQNAAETFSSFDGSAKSVVDGIQGTFGGLVASLGQISPALIPIGIVGAAAVGLISSAITGAEVKSEDFKAKVAELTEQLIESGVIGKRSFEDMVDDVRDLATETDDSKTNLEDLRDIAKTLGRPFQDVVSAYSAGGDALQELIDQTQELKDAEQERYAQQLENDPNKVYAPLLDGGLEYEQQLNSQLGLMRDQQDAIAQATELQSLYYSSGVTEMEAKASLIEQVNKAYDDGASSVEDFINKETLTFDAQGFIDSMAKREQALKDYQDTLATVNLSPEARAHLASLGADQAAIVLQGYKNATPAQQRELNRIWTESGKQNSGSYLTSVQSGLSAAKPLTGPQVNLQSPDVQALLRGLQGQLNSRSLSVTVKPVDPYGRPLY